jgi:hypothetical protein
MSQLVSAAIEVWNYRRIGSRICGRNGHRVCFTEQNLGHIKTTPNSFPLGVEACRNSLQKVE